jgi:hypothetical protein
MPLRARDIADICDELAIERASVTVMGGWDPDATQFTLSFGPIGYRQTMVIDPKWEIGDVRMKLEAAIGPVLVAQSPREIVRMDPVPPEVLIQVAPLDMPALRASVAKISEAKPAQKRKKAKNG